MLKAEKFLIFEKMFRNFSVDVFYYSYFLELLSLQIITEIVHNIKDYVFLFCFLFEHFIFNNSVL